MTAGAGGGGLGSGDREPATLDRIWDGPGGLRCCVLAIDGGARAWATDDVAVECERLAEQVEAAADG